MYNIGLTRLRDLLRHCTACLKVWRVAALAGALSIKTQSVKGVQGGHGTLSHGSGMNWALAKAVYSWSVALPWAALEPWEQADSNNLR